MRLHLQALRRLVVFDTLRERAYDCFDRVDSFPELCDLLLRNPVMFRVAYRSLDATTLQDDFNRCAAAVYACRNLTFAIEEVELFSNAHSLPLPLEMVISVGRHRDLSLYCTSRRPHAVNALIRSQAQEIYSFTQTEPRDVDWCREVMGEQADNLPKLRHHAFIRWSDTQNTHTQTSDEPDEKEALPS